MKVTAIKQQIRREGRYSIFVDNEYVLSLSAQGLLDSKLVVGQELDETQIGDLKTAAETDKLYNDCLRYLSIRLRSVWEVEQYLKRKQASPALIESILNTLSNKNLLNDARFAELFVRDRQRLRPSSMSKLRQELILKHIDKEVISAVLNSEEEPMDERAALRAVISKARRQSRYHDDVKLMQYLSRQGFHYGDIKDAIAESNNEG